MAELKPCPFCGGEAKEVYRYDPFDGYQGDCGCFIASCSKCSTQIAERTKEKAIEAWNRRAEDGN